MKLKAFIEIVELKTKVASLIPFLGAVGYLLLTQEKIIFFNILLFFIAMLLIDMSTTALNHYRGIIHEEDKTLYDENLLKTLKRNNWTKETILILLLSMISIALFVSLYLVLNSNYLVLILGIYCVIIAFLYSFGPIPICTTFLGEFFSGTTMGIVIPILVVLVNYGNSVFHFKIEPQSIILVFNLKYFTTAVLVFLPFAFCIANILLANNICDLENDYKNNRFTLAVQLGSKKATILWGLTYLLTFFVIALEIVLQIVPLFFVLIFITTIPVLKNIRQFNEKKIKEVSFIYSVKNFLLVCGSYSVLLLIIGGIKYYG